jgi:hypothetical protein
MLQALAVSWEVIRGGFLLVMSVAPEAIAAMSGVLLRRRLEALAVAIQVTPDAVGGPRMRGRVPRGRGCSDDVDRT